MWILLFCFSIHFIHLISLFVPDLIGFCFYDLILKLHWLVHSHITLYNLRCTVVLACPSQLVLFYDTESCNWRKCRNPKADGVCHVLLQRDLAQIYQSSKWTLVPQVAYIVAFIRQSKLVSSSAQWLFQMYWHECYIKYFGIYWSAVSKYVSDTIMFDNLGSSLKGVKLMCREVMNDQVMGLLGHTVDLFCYWFP